jgi:hypothetical protein
LKRVADSQMSGGAGSNQRPRIRCETNASVRSNWTVFAGLRLGRNRQTSGRPHHRSFSSAVRFRGYARGYTKLTIGCRAILASNHYRPTNLTALWQFAALLQAWRPSDPARSTAWRSESFEQFVGGAFARHHREAGFAFQQVRERGGKQLLRHLLR